MGRRRTPPVWGAQGSEPQNAARIFGAWGFSMQEISNAHFACGQVRPESTAQARARRIAETLGAPVERVAAIMISAAPNVAGYDLGVFDNMRADHLEILRLLACGESESEVAIKIRRAFNPNATTNTVRAVRLRHLEAFRIAVRTGRVSADLSASTASRLSRRELQPGRRTQVQKKPQPVSATQKPRENKLADKPATVSRPVSHPQPAMTGHPAEVSATHAPWWAVRPNFSQPSAGQIAPRLVDYDRLTGRPAGSGQ